MYEKRKRGIAWQIEGKRNLISLRLAAFVTTFVSNLVRTYKFHGNLETAKGPVSSSA